MPNKSSAAELPVSFLLIFSLLLAGSLLLLTTGGCLMIADMATFRSALLDFLLHEKPRLRNHHVIDNNTLLYNIYNSAVLKQKLILVTQAASAVQRRQEQYHSDLTMQLRPFLLVGVIIFTGHCLSTHGCELGSAAMCQSRLL